MCQLKCNKLLTVHVPPALNYGTNKNSTASTHFWMIASSIFFQCAQAWRSGGNGCTITGRQSSLHTAVTRMMRRAVLTTERLEHMRFTWAQHVFNSVPALCVQCDQRIASIQSKLLTSESSNNDNPMALSMNRKCIGINNYSIYGNW